MNNRRLVMLGLRRMQRDMRGGWRHVNERSTAAHLLKPNSVRQLASMSFPCQRPGIGRLRRFQIRPFQCSALVPSVRFQRLSSSGIVNPCAEIENATTPKVITVISPRSVTP
ncbi:hypothetical protein QP166_05550 [Sphingomonas sp. LR60]|uniref:hypothetical protein n=1 Tax=Sphingomonas sp. LR60 TaxID=3050233 RepID=UPI002FE07325